MIQIDATTSLLFKTVPCFILYAEIHRKFLGFFSLVKHNLPEIIADVPYRVEPQHPLPIICLIKDANHYPIVLHRIWYKLHLANGQVKQQNLWDIPVKISSRYWYKIFKLDLPHDRQQFLSLDLHVEVERKDKKYHCTNDNYRGTSHASFKIWMANEPLPRFPNLLLGDVHYHSNYTDDQVEFGAPLPIAVEMAQAIGLDFFCVTDHSYDLDDYPHNCLQNDPSLTKWKMFHREVKTLNQAQQTKTKPVIIIPGEEVSVRNSQGRNVHMLVLNDGKFYPGSGDSAENWFKLRSEFQIADILQNLSDHAIAIAAHSGYRAPLLEYLLIQRGKWEMEDCELQNLTGLQILNGENNESFRRGLHQWRELLLKGKKLYIFAGNDAHGNFNRYRQLGLPFLHMRERQAQLFGQMRTAVFVEKPAKLEQIVTALKQGISMITSGPVANLQATGEHGHRANLGETIHDRKIQLRILAKSSLECGALQEVILLRGDLQQRQEIVLQLWREFSSNWDFETILKCSIPSGHEYYYRLEILTDKGNFCYTNPIWQKAKKKAR